MSKKKTHSENENIVEYNNAKRYEIILFALNNTSTNMYNFMMGYVTYYATGVAGLAVLLVSTLLTGMRIFDGLVDPIIGFVMDKTSGRFGKFRPFLVLGNLTMILSITLMYNTTHLIEDTTLKLVYFLVVYFIYVIGYSFQTTATKTGQSVITNNPKQRPLFSTYDSIYSMIRASLTMLWVTNYLVPKHGGFTASMFREFTTGTMLVSFVLMVLAVIGIWKKDQPEYFGLGEGSEPSTLKIKDYWPIIKENRALQMLTVAASTDKLGSKINTHAVSGVILYGIIIGDYALSGQLGLIGLLPTLGITILVTTAARKYGQKKMYVFAQGSAFIFSGLAVLWLLLGNPSSISLTNFNWYTLGFIVLTILVSVQGAGDALQISMISDVTDYETARSGRFVPGMIGTIFSFIDNFFSSFSTSIVGFILAAVGYSTTLPEVGDSLTPTLLVLGLGLFYGSTMIAWAISLIAMKFYPLDRETMVEVQQKIHDRKQEGKIKTEEKIVKEDMELEGHVSDNLASEEN